MSTAELPPTVDIVCVPGSVNLICRACNQWTVIKLLYRCSVSMCHWRVVLNELLFLAIVTRLGKRRKLVESLFQ